MFTYNIFYKTQRDENALSYQSLREIPASQIDSIVLYVVIRREIKGSADSELFTSILACQLHELETIQTVMNRYALAHIAYEYMGRWTNIDRRMLFEKAVLQPMEAIGSTGGIPL